MDITRDYGSRNPGSNPGRAANENVRTARARPTPGRRPRSRLGDAPRHLGSENMAVEVCSLWAHRSVALVETIRPAMQAVQVLLVKWRSCNPPKVVFPVRLRGRTLIAGWRSLVVLASFIISRPQVQILLPHPAASQGGRRGSYPRPRGFVSLCCHRRGVVQGYFALQARNGGSNPPPAMKRDRLVVRTRYKEPCASSSSSSAGVDQLVGHQPLKLALSGFESQSRFQARRRSGVHRDWFTACHQNMPSRFESGSSLGRYHPRFLRSEGSRWAPCFGNRRWRVRFPLLRLVCSPPWGRGANAKEELWPARKLLSCCPTSRTPSGRRCSPGTGRSLTLPATGSSSTTPTSSSALGRLVTAPSLQGGRAGFDPPSAHRRGEAWRF